MKKSAILALALVFVGAVLFVAWRALRSEPTKALERDVEHAVEPGSHPPTLERTDETSHAPSARLQAGHASSAAADAGISSSSLRVHVLFSSGPDEHRKGLEVRASNRTGVVHDAHEVGANEFRVGEIAPGPYVVAVTAPGFRSAVAQVDVAPTSAETVTEVTLVPERIVRVSWLSRDGKPIEQALSSADIDDDLARLEVFASITPIVEDGPPPDRVAFASLYAEFVHHQVDQDRREANELALPGSSFERTDPRWTPGTLGFLTVDEPGPIWVSAWCCGALVDTQRVEPAQDTVVFRSSVEDLGVKRVPVSMVVVDDESGAPISDASLSILDHHRSEGETPTRDGPGNLKLLPGWKTMYVRAEGYAESTLRFRVPITGSLDLGTIRLSRANLGVAFHVVDGGGKPVDIVIFELVRLSSYDGTATPYDIHQEWSSKPGHPGQVRESPTSLSANRSAGDEHGLLEFGGLSRDRYVLRCMDPSVDSPPLVVEPGTITSDRTRIAGEIVVTKRRLVSFVFHPPLSQGSLVMIETPDGLPVRTLETNEFGVVATALGAKDYSLHLVEGGRATEAIRFTVTTDPFVLEIDH